MADANEREVTMFLNQVEAALAATLDGFATPEDGPRFHRVLGISALVDLAGRLMVADLETGSQDYASYRNMLDEIAARIAPFAPEMQRRH